MLRAAIATLALILSACFASAQIPADSRMKRIADTKTIKLGYRAAATPFSFLGDKKEPVGYTIDLCTIVVDSIGKSLGGAAQDRMGGGDDAESLRHGGAGQGRHGMRLFDHHAVAHEGGRFLLDHLSPKAPASSSRPRPAFQKAIDLDGKKIAVAMNTTNERALADLIKQGTMKAVLVPVKDRDAGVAALEKGEVDAYASDKLLLVGARFSDPNAMTHAARRPFARALRNRAAARRLGVAAGGQYRRSPKSIRSGQIASVFGKWFNQIGLKPGPLLLSAFTLGALPQ